MNDIGLFYGTYTGVTRSVSEKIAKNLGVPVLATMPIRPQTATLVDLGQVDTANAPEATEAFAKIKEALGDED